MNDPLDPEVEAFLKDYREICLKHQLIIGACGCCDSPWLVPLKNIKLDEALQHLREE